MRIALVEGEPREAKPDSEGSCRLCGDPMVSKCGELRIWHWAHKRSRTCDAWWEPETPWHRDWKNQFPTDWQEYIHVAPNYEKHVADVKTDHGLTFEFQHSFLPAAERISREAFYSRLIWVVDGQRRLRDRTQFFSALGNAVLQSPLIIAARVGESSLLRDWNTSRVPVYFDFGASMPTDPLRFDIPTLWRLNPSDSKGSVYLSPVSKIFLIGSALQGIDFEEPFTRELDALLERRRTQEALRNRREAPFGLYTAPTRRHRFGRFG